jgi:hypothetical protein
MPPFFIYFKFIFNLKRKKHSMRIFIFIKSVLYYAKDKVR